MLKIIILLALFASMTKKCVCMCDHYLVPDFFFLSTMKNLLNVWFLIVKHVMSGSLPTNFQNLALANSF